VGDAQGELFATSGAPAAGATPAPSAPTVGPEAEVVRVLPDVRAMRAPFDYAVPAAVTGTVMQGSVVDVDLAGRRLRGWVVDTDVTPPSGVALREFRRVRSVGPDPSVVALTQWGAWRFAGARTALLGTATAPVRVTAVPRDGPDAQAAPPDGALAAGQALSLRFGAALDGMFTDPVTVVRLAPGTDSYPVVAAAAGLGPTLVVAPSYRQADEVLRRLGTDGHKAVGLPGGWAEARTGGVSVVGTRVAAWAPCRPLAAVVVLDEHDEGHFQEHSPTWHARTVAVERARAAGVPCVLVSPTPSLEAITMAPVVPESPSTERSGWPVTHVVDQRYEDPLRSGLISERLAELARGGGRVLCVLNRKGRARLLACNGCSDLVRCGDCGSAVGQDAGGDLVCGACAARRPPLCLTCGRTSLRAVRRGVSRLRDDLEILVGEPVAELTGSKDDAQPSTRVVVGTTAALHQMHRADVVAFCDFDQELLAPRYRAAEQAMALLVLAARLVQPRGTGQATRSQGGAGTGAIGRLVVQTSVPDHPALVAAATGDPTAFAAGELERRVELGWPPATAMALVSGAVAEAFIDGVERGSGIEVLGPVDDRWIVRAPDHSVLCDALAAAPRPAGRLRIEVDPLRL
jgi:primosomal protein N' (replication factor Y)